MKKISKNLLMLILLSLFLIISIIPYYHINEYSSEAGEIIDNINGENKKIKTSDSWVISSININGNAEWASTASTQDWCSGSGNWTHPYVIENVTIDGQGSGSCITIQNSDVYFIINNCTVYNSGELWESNAGVRLHNVKNGTLSNINSSYNNMDGIYMTNCVNNSLIGINATYNANSGIYLKQSHNNRINNCHINNNGMQQIYVYGSHNNNITQTKIITIASSSYSTGINNRESNTTLLLGNTIKDLLGTGINFWDSHNSTIVGNTLTNISGSGIYISGVNHNISGNNMKGCGIVISYQSLRQMASIKIDTLNKVTEKPVYYYVNKSNLRANNFSNGGQVILAHCNDSLIEGLNTSYCSRAMVLYNCINSTVLNNNGTFNDIFIFLQNGMNNTILGNTIKNNYDMGIYVQNETNCNISDNVLYYIEQEAIRIRDCDTCNLSRNLMKDSGIDPSGSSSQMASYNIDSTNKVNGKPYYYYVSQNGLESSDFLNAGQIYLYKCNYSSVSNQNVSYTNTGIVMKECSHNIIFKVNATFNSDEGIFLRNAENITVSECNLNYNGDGMFTRDIKNCNYIRNNLSYNRGGLEFSYMENTNVLYNIINNNENHGIDFDSIASFNNFTGNKIQNNGKNGINCGNSDHNNFTRNLIDNNGEVGFFLVSLSNVNTVSFNNITNNNQIGLYISSTDSNYIFGNEFIGNQFHAMDDGTNNYWNNSYIGNYWDNYTGNDNNNDGIGEDSYSIAGSANSEDYKPLKITIWGDFDGDELSNIEEFLDGNDNYVTNATNPDTDYDGMPDGWESVNLLNPTMDDALGDAEGDLLLNIYEYRNGTDPQSSDSDGDTSRDPLFDDYYEVNAGTDPTNEWWYPMPNLRVLDFTTTNARQGESFVLNFTIKNDGIHGVSGIVIIIKVDDLNKILYNNTAEPMSLSVDGTINKVVTSSDLDQVGKWSLTLTIDPLDLINETYSQKDGSLRSNSNNDNFKQTVIEISSADGSNGEDEINIILIIIVVSAAVGVFIAGFVFVRRFRHKLQATERELESLKQQRTEITEDDIVLSKEQHFCLVHKGPIEGYNFICPQCGAYYCAKCVEAIKEIENACWSCQKPLDPSKPIKESKEKEDIKPILDDESSDIKDLTMDELKDKKIMPKKAPKDYKVPKYHKEEKE